MKYIYELTLEYETLDQKQITMANNKTDENKIWRWSVPWEKMTLASFSFSRL